MFFLASGTYSQAVVPPYTMGILESKHQRQFDNECLKPDGQRNPVPSFTTEDVLAEAEKLYAFVQKK